eukprot:TRINITY_DN17719_c0_g1_i3.p1 TRINITY_DN17719_c0_g1~~TRINITY_DN17719_c0_g1_i3.p1  ORF type:complete len:422 (-),score=86.71 TRINITY_DN17719_c0_g1_i3:433-1647(-)
MSKASKRTRADTYTSGTTGQPKGVLRDVGGHAVALKWSMEHFYNVREGDTFWAASDIGWVVGHSYTIYAPLLHGCTSVMYEGKPIVPDAGVFWRVCEEYNVKALFAAPTAFRAIRKVDPELSLAKKYDLSGLQSIFLAGERADPETVTFFAESLQKPIVDHWWQTELGGPALGFQTECVGTRAGSAARALPGFDVHVLCRDSSHKLEDNELGDLAIRLPLPPGTFQTLYNADERCQSVYYSKHNGYYLTGDAGMRDKDGYFHVMARTDDVINCAGHRLSSGAIEEVLSSHEDVAECAVVGAACPEKTQVPVGLIVIRDGAEKSRETIEEEVIGLVRRDIGPVAAFKNALAVDALPKTRSGKILRGIMLKMANQEEYNVPGTIEDMSSVEHVHDVIRRRWVAQRV